jgi:hypothetical protein
MRLIPPRATPFLLFIHPHFDFLSHYPPPSLVHPTTPPRPSRNDDDSSTMSVLLSTTSIATLYSAAGVIAERSGHSNSEFGQHEKLRRAEHSSTTGVTWNWPPLSSLLLTNAWPESVPDHKPPPICTTHSNFPVTSLPRQLTISSPPLRPGSFTVPCGLAMTFTWTPSRHNSLRSSPSHKLYLLPTTTPSGLVPANVSSRFP